MCFELASVLPMRSMLPGLRTSIDGSQANVAELADNLPRRDDWMEEAPKWPSGLWRQLTVSLGHQKTRDLLNLVIHFPKVGTCLPKVQTWFCVMENELLLLSAKTVPFRRNEAEKQSNSHSCLALRCVMKFLSCWIRERAYPFWCRVLQVLA